MIRYGTIKGNNKHAEDNNKSADAGIKLTAGPFPKTVNAHTLML